MKNTSRRARRMARTHKRNKKSGTLNLTALMDIFTILVFFLMVNQNDVKVEKSEQIELPASVADTLPEENLVVMINRTEILVGGRAITSVAQAMNAEEEIPSLIAELQRQAERITPALDADGNEIRPITVVGDKDTPYELLKKVMNACSSQTFTDIFLVVNQITEGGA